MKICFNAGDMAWSINTDRKLLWLDSEYIFKDLASDKL